METPTRADIFILHAIQSEAKTKSLERQAQIRDCEQEGRAGTAVRRALAAKESTRSKAEQTHGKRHPAGSKPEERPQSVAAATMRPTRFPSTSAAALHGAAGGSGRGARIRASAGGHSFAALFDFHSSCSSSTASDPGLSSESRHTNGEQSGRSRRSAQSRRSALERGGCARAARQAGGAPRKHAAGNALRQGRRKDASGRERYHNEKSEKLKRAREPGAREIRCDEERCIRTRNWMRRRKM
jgi:hypothetical protein